MEKRLIGAQLDLGLIEEVDEAAKRLGVNRSTFIRQALLQLIEATKNA
jgi:metal-responsive CopG/Arc/MetJ family transcriptional regulator